ncbi:hypothetical protein CERSUDRAFT_118467 [Gelatoporia subvermispora B]|uniref:F-box domain-containing protein n=1 Tax=Ceriporiopsis subvermispora (strain B) TaxID=914234 RepID=M2R1F7_CERS8|nr:hypothetical protein CERSUDRAFT_118467 [Gelatoporia subvermispora B]
MSVCSSDRITTTATETVPLGYDIALHVLEYLQEDYPSLCNCALVNHVFHDAAAKLLYRQVIYSPAPSRVLDLRRREEFVGGIYTSSRLTHNAPHVLALEVSGYLSSRPIHITKLAENLLNGIRSWPNLQTVNFTPKQYDENLFTDVLPLLRECASLRYLTVGPACINTALVPALMQIEGLESLTIHSPTRILLEHLPEWLGQLSRTLHAFYLKDNCGSVTPGVLRSLAPGLQRIRAFGLGLSYSLTDDDVFAFLNQLPRLTTLELRYYLQFKPPTTRAHLPSLRSLAVIHTFMPTREDAAYLIKWLRRILHSAQLATLRLLCEDDFPECGANVSVDGLLAHLGARHAESLRVLRMDAAFVGRRELAALCARCEGLEEVGVAVSADVLYALPEMVKSLARLRVLTVNTRNRRQSRAQAGIEQMQAFFDHGSENLRQVVVNGVSWEGKWTTTHKGVARFVVEESPPPRVPSWETGAIAPAAL